jgi:hypothetical protein
MKEKYISRVSLEYVPGKQGNVTWGRKDEEFIADFCLVSRRTLDEGEYRIFKFVFLLGADWKLCARRLKMDRGSFFHAVYRIEQKLGRTFRDLQPYGLYPLDMYFHGPRRTPVGKVYDPFATPSEPVATGRRAFGAPLERVA